MIGQDPVMTAKMLQLVNSPYFGLAYPVTNAMEAVMFMGAERTKSLILLTKIFSQFDNKKCAGFDPEGLWKHLLSVAFTSRSITMAETEDNKRADAAFTGGLLHDIGKLMLAENLPEQYSEMLKEAKRRTFPLQAIELATFGATHSELGACLLATWGLPLPILEAVALHHTPLASEDEEFSILTAVHAANVIEEEKSAGRKPAGGVRMDPAYLARIQLIERRNRWRELCDCPIKPQEEASGHGARAY
jgi:putative nucleotidyltransferase with HDIG domain